MNRFSVRQYDATSFITPTTSYAFEVIEETFKIPSKLIRTHYQEDISLVLSTYYTDPVSSLVIIESELLLTKFGMYSFKIIAVGGTAEILIDDVVIATTLLAAGEGNITLFGGIKEIKVRFVGATATGSFTITWKEPGQLSFSSIPMINRPIYNNTLFPFEIYEQVDQSIEGQYKVLGLEYQKQQYTRDAEPSKTFKVNLKQTTVDERVFIKSWFKSLKGKYKTFLFNARNNAFSLDEAPVVGDQFILVKKAYTTIAYSYMNKLLFFPKLDFAAQVYLSEEYTNVKGESCDKLYLSEVIPQFQSPSDCMEVTFLYYCRLDTDTLTFELHDINYSSVQLSLQELYNDNSIINVI